MREEERENREMKRKEGEKGRKEGRKKGGQERGTIPVIKASQLIREE